MMLDWDLIKKRRSCWVQFAIMFVMHGHRNVKFIPKVFDVVYEHTE